MFGNMNHAGHGSETTAQALQKSCNIAFAHIGLRTGGGTLYDYCRAFGLMEQTGIDLPGEAFGVFHTRERLANTASYGTSYLIATSFGQTIKPTPIQLVTAISAVVNGGYLLEPYVVSEIVDSEGNVVQQNARTVVRQVISEETSATMRQIIESASIDINKCISCGNCVYQCPFGAIQDKSWIMDAIQMLRGSEHWGYKTYAVIAPSIAGQFAPAKYGQVVAGLKALGFSGVAEVALGADMVAWREAQELAEKKFLTSSCCPAFVDYIRKSFPDMAQHISHNLSPMGEIAKYIKRIHPGCKVVFIVPCTAKKAERKQERVKDLVDCVLTFEELQALFDSKEIDLTSLPGEALDNASYFGRVFARSGGLAVAVEEALKECGISPEEFTLNAISCNGITECKAALLRASKNVLPNNFVEGMACESGCIGGAGCITHGPKSKADVDKYGHEAMEKTIKDAIEILNF